MTLKAFCIEAENLRLSIEKVQMQILQVNQLISMAGPEAEISVQVRGHSPWPEPADVTASALLDSLTSKKEVLESEYSSRFVARIAAIEHYLDTHNDAGIELVVLDPPVEVPPTNSN